MKVKKIVAILLVFVMVITNLGGCAAKKNEFKESAKAFFGELCNNPTLKTEQKTEFLKEGWYSYKMPVTKSDVDSKINDYYAETVTSFLYDSQKDDTLLIGFKEYLPASDVGSIEVVYKKTTGEKVTTKSKIFSFDKNSDTVFNKELEAAVMGQVKAKLYDKDAKLKQMSYNDGGFLVKVEGGKSCTVEYHSVYNYLPESVKNAVGEPTKRYVDTTKKLVAITFDDGPCVYTDDILDILEKHDSVATFFELGNLLQYREDAVKRADKMGCEVAGHSYSHKNLPKQSLEVLKSEISKTDAELERILGKTPSIARPPYGSVSDKMLANCGKAMIGWSVDTMDWSSRDKDKVVASVKKAGNLDGDVVLMHSLYKSTVDATKELIPYLIKNGYQLVTVSELYQYRHNQKLEIGKYYN